MKVEKYHGSGNDFLILEKQENINYNELAKRLCDRHLSFGADGLIILDINKKFVYFYNADGSESEVCGNGLRCVCLYLFNHHYDFEYVYAKDGKHYLEKTNDLISVSFPLKLPLEIKIDEWYLCGKKHQILNVNVGNPHVVILSCLKEDEIKCFEEYSSSKGININFVEIISNNKIRIKTIERGVGLTNSCGSGAVASAISLYQTNQISNPVKIINNYGNLIVDLNDKVTLIGLSEFVYKGEFDG